MRDIAFEIEAVHTKSEKLRDLQQALFVAIYRQKEYEPQEFEWAFVVLDEIANDIAADLKELTDTAFDQMRGKKGGAV